MIVTLITYVQMFCFLIQHISTQYNYQQDPYNQHSYPQNYQQVSYPQQYEDPRGFYQYQDRNQNAVPYENAPNYQQSRYRGQHWYGKPISRRSRYRDRSSSDDTISDNDSYNSYGECKCSCSKCESPEPPPCCEPLCDSCPTQPQPNPGLMIFPYPYPLIIAGIEPKKNDNKGTSPTTIVTPHETKPDNTEVPTKAISKEATTEITTEAPTAATTTITTTTTVPPTATTTTVITTPSSIETVTISGQGNITQENITRLLEETRRQFDKDPYYDYLRSKNPHARYNEDLNGLSIRRSKERILPRYGIVPISDELALKLMTQMRRMNAVQTRKQKPFILPRRIDRY